MLTITIQADFSPLQDEAAYQTFRDSVQQSIAKVVRVPSADVEIASLTPGSVVVLALVSFYSATDEDKARVLMSGFAANPTSALTKDFQEAKGTVSSASSRWIKARVLGETLRCGPHHLLHVQVACGCAARHAAAANLSAPAPWPGVMMQRMPAAAAHVVASVWLLACMSYLLLPCGTPTAPAASRPPTSAAWPSSTATHPAVCITQPGTEQHQHPAPPHQHYGTRHSCTILLTSPTPASHPPPFTPSPQAKPQAWATPR